MNRCVEFFIIGFPGKAVSCLSVSRESCTVTAGLKKKEKYTEIVLLTVIWSEKVEFIVG